MLTMVKDLYSQFIGLVCCAQEKRWSLARGLIFNSLGDWVARNDLAFNAAVFDVDSVVELII